MDESLTRALELAARQGGFVARRQLLALGRTSRQIEYAVASQALLKVHRGVYRIAGTPLTRNSDLFAGLLLTDGVISHRTAARMLGIIEATDVSEFTVVPTAGAFRSSGLIVHRMADLVPADILRIEGLPCTNATRTLIDLGAVVGTGLVESALERALHLRLTAISRLESRLDQLARQGRPGVAALRRVLATRSPSLAPTQSELELLIWQILRRYRVPLPERQVKVTVGGERFFLDMAYPAEQIFIEGDGFGVHGGREAFEDDRWRQNLLVVAEWRPLRFTWRQARRRATEVANQVLGALSARRPSRSA